MSFRQRDKEKKKKKSRVWFSIIKLFYLSFSRQHSSSHHHLHPFICTQEAPKRKRGNTKWKEKNNKGRDRDEQQKLLRESKRTIRGSLLTSCAASEGIVNMEPRLLCADSYAGVRLASLRVIDTLRTTSLRPGGTNQWETCHQCASRLWAEGGSGIVTKTTLG